MHIPENQLLLAEGAYQIFPHVRQSLIEFKAGCTDLRILSLVKYPEAARTIKIIYSEKKLTLWYFVLPEEWHWARLPRVETRVCVSHILSYMVLSELHVT